jgi:hypothetical protein
MGFDFRGFRGALRPSMALKKDRSAMNTPALLGSDPFPGRRFRAPPADGRCSLLGFSKGAAVSPESAALT